MKTRKSKHESLAVAYAGFSKGGGAGNMRIMKTKKKRSLKFSLFFFPDLDEDQKKEVFTQVLPRFSARIPKEGAMTQLCALFFGIYVLLAPQRGGHGTMASPKYAPGHELSEHDVRKKNTRISDISGKMPVRYRYNSASIFSKLTLRSSILYHCCFSLLHQQYVATRD